MREIPEERAPHFGPVFAKSGAFLWISKVYVETAAPFDKLRAGSRRNAGTDETFPNFGP